MGGRAHRIYIHRLSFQSSELGPPPPNGQGSVAPPPFGSKVKPHSLAGKGVRGPNSDEGTDNLVLYEYYNPSAEGGILKDLRLPNYKALTGGPGASLHHQIRAGCFGPEFSRLSRRTLRKSAVLSSPIKSALS